MSLKNTRNYLTMLAVAALSAGSALAGSVTTYTTFNSWQGALTGAPVEAVDFSSGPVSNNQVTGVFGIFFVTGTASNAIPNALEDLSGTMTVTAPAGGTSALMLYLGANQANTASYAPNQNLTITLTDSGLNQQTFTLTTGSTSLPWGFTSGVAINTVTITAPGGYDVDLLDFYAGKYTAAAPPADPTPESSTLLMIGGGLVFLGTKRKFAPLA